MIVIFLHALSLATLPLLSMENKHEQGMKIRRAVLGDAHVDRAEANKTPFDADFQQFITETAWGTVWSRPGLDHKTRHLLTIAMMAALGKEHELAMHIRATQNTGVTPDEVKEVLLQVAIYAGVPAANTAMAVAKRIYNELDEEAQK
jgi:4-carboxymuconolactone decarboxylase